MAVNPGVLLRILGLDGESCGWSKNPRGWVENP